MYKHASSLYSLPNVILPFFGGLLVDAVGYRAMTVSTAGVALLGQVLVAGGVFARNWWGMWVGRAVFGIGTESLTVVNRVFIARWFVGKELALAMVREKSRIGVGVAFDGVSLAPSPHACPRHRA
jgi:MFS family permease